MNVFKLPLADRLFDNSSIKYVIVPIQDIANDDDFFVSYGGKNDPNIRDWYIAEMDRVSWLKKIDIGTQELAVYENENYKPHIYSDSDLNYFQTNAGEFGDFGKSQSLYLNSDLEKNGYLFGRLGNIVVPVEADPEKIAELKLAVGKTTDAKEKKKLQGDLDLYAKNLFFKDYKLKIPAKANYKIYLKSDSVLAGNKDISVQIGREDLQENGQPSGKDGWKYFNQMELDKGEYDLNVYHGFSLTDTINSGDIVLSAENLSEPIRTPQLEYRQINPTKYIVNVRGASESFPLVFSESFHSEWKIYAEPGVAAEETGKFVSESNQGTIQNENLDGGRFFDLLLRKPVLDDKHFMINGFANSWWIDVSELEKQGKIAKNSDGGYDFSVYIEFEPQKYFYVGLLISIATLIACVGYLLANLCRWYIMKKEKKI
jgi:hypothetical protein